MNDSLGILETYGLTPSLVAVDGMENAAEVRVVQSELNDLGGVVTKIVGAASAVETAVAAGSSIAAALGGRPAATVIHRPDDGAWPAIESPKTYNPLVEQDVVFFPSYQPIQSSAAKDSEMSQANIAALGIIETQGFTAVFEAIDTACKAASVEVIGKEKLGGGFIAVIVRGELSAVTAAIDAGRGKVEGLGKLIAAHVIARPTPSVLALLPKV